MAEGAWVPAFDSIWNHRKTTKLVRDTTGIPMQRRHAVAGLFLELMAWARDTVETGDLGLVDPGDLAAAVGLPRARGPQLLAALKAADLVSNDSRAHVAGWEDGPGKLVASRRQARERQRVHREREKEKGTVTRDVSTKSTPINHPSPVTATDVTRDVPVTSRARGEETRGEEKRTPPPPTQDPPTPSAGEEAELAWFWASVAEEHGWRATVEELARRTPLANVMTWFRATRAEASAEGLTVVVPNAFARNWLAEKGYTARIRDARSAAGLGVPAHVTYVVADARPPEPMTAPPERQPDAEPPILEPERDAETPYQRVREASR